MSIHPLPEAIPSLNTAELRQRLAGLIDQQSQAEEWFNESAKSLSIGFCAALPAVFSDSLDRVTMWDKIASAIQSAYAKTVGGDLDLFMQQVFESIQADPSKVVASDRMVSAIDSLQRMDEQQRQDWMRYLVTHLIPVLVHARREHKSVIGGVQ